MSNQKFKDLVYPFRETLKQKKQKMTEDRKERGRKLVKTQKLRNQQFWKEKFKSPMASMNRWINETNVLGVVINTRVRINEPSANLLFVQSEIAIRRTLENNQYGHIDRVSVQSDYYDDEYQMSESSDSINESSDHVFGSKSRSEFGCVPIGK